MLVLVLTGSLLSAAPAVASGAAEAAPDDVWYAITLAPEAAPVGAPVRVQGYIAEGPYQTPRAGASVAIYFDPYGTAPREHVGTASTDSDGWFAKTFRSGPSGVYDVVASGGGTVRGRTAVTFTKRATSQAVRSGIASGSRDGLTGSARVIVQDVVTRLEPQTVYLDAGLLTPGYYGNLRHGPYMTNRRAEGLYGVGTLGGASQIAWRTPYSAVTSYRMSALHPAGLYDVYFAGPIHVYTDFWDLDGDGMVQATRVPIAEEPVTTLRVRRASSTTVSASSTSFTGPKTITLRGTVRKVQLVSRSEAAVRLAPNTSVKLYFDPAGAAGPQYRKTVRTNSQGVYNTRCWTSRSGRWIAKYPGTGLQAPSQKAVTVTVR